MIFTKKAWWMTLFLMNTCLQCPCKPRGLLILKFTSSLASFHSTSPIMNTTKTQGKLLHTTRFRVMYSKWDLIMYFVDGILRIFKRVRVLYAPSVRSKNNI
jgi:hypothetical protein